MLALKIGFSLLLAFNSASRFYMVGKTRQPITRKDAIAGIVIDAALVAVIWFQIGGSK